jgi:hypothetical protein
VADVEVAVGVGQGGGDEEFARGGHGRGALSERGGARLKARARASGVAF